LLASMTKIESRIGLLELQPSFATVTLGSLEVGGSPNGYFDKC
jgi:hypothetical protein